MSAGSARRIRTAPLLLTIVVACSGAGTTSVAAPAPTTLTTTPATVTTTSIATDGEGPLYLRPIHPTTLKDIPGKIQLGVGGATWNAVSPDGRWLAVVAFDTAGGGDPGLTLVDTRSWSWTDRVPMPELEPISSIAVTNQGTVVWIHSPGDHPYVYRLVRDSSEPELIVDLEASRWPMVQPTDIGMLTDDRLTLLAYEFDGEHYGGFVHVLGVDLDTGVLRDLILPEVWQGHIPQVDIDQASVASLDPGWAFDRGDNLLYVVPADRDEALVVDVDSMEVTRRESWHQPDSLLDRLVAWWVPTARAKGADIARRQIELSPDGSKLFIATDAPTTGRIDALDTETLEVVASSDLWPIEISLSPNDSALLAVGSFHPRTPGPGGGVYLLDPESLVEEAHVLPELDFNLGGYSSFAPDGKHAYAWSHVQNSEAILYLVIDLENPRAVAVRKVYWPGFAIPHVGVLAAADR